MGNVGKLSREVIGLEASGPEHRSGKNPGAIRVDPEGDHKMLGIQKVGNGRYSDYFSEIPHRALLE